MAQKLTYMWNIVAKLAKLQKSILSRVNPTATATLVTLAKIINRLIDYSMKSLPNNHVEVKGIPISKQDV